MKHKIQLQAQLHSQKKFINRKDIPNEDEAKQLYGEMESYGKWERAALCVSCHVWLGRHAAMYSNGVCPSCGFLSKGTICDTYDIVLRLQHYDPKSWWALFNVSHWVKKNIK